MQKYIGGLVKLNQFLLSDGYNQSFIKPGKYSGLLIRVTSTGNNSDTVDPDVLGTIKLTLNGSNVIVNSDYSRIKQLNDFDGFAKTYSVANGSPLNATFMIPFATPEDNKNVLEINSVNEASLEFYNVASTNVGTGGMITVYGIINNLGVASYVLKTVTLSDVVSQGNNIMVKPVAALKNIVRILMENDSYIDDIYVMENGEQRYSLDDETLDIASQMFNTTESAASVSYFDLKMFTGVYESFLNSDVNIYLNVSTGSATVKFLIQTMSFNDSTSRAVSEADVSMKIGRKLDKQSIRTVEAYQSL